MSSFSLPLRYLSAVLPTARSGQLDGGAFLPARRRPFFHSLDGLMPRMMGKAYGSSKIRPTQRACRYHQKRIRMKFSMVEKTANQLIGPTILSLDAYGFSDGPVLSAPSPRGALVTP